MRSQSLGLDQGLREKREGAEHHDSCAGTPTGGETETGKGEGGGSALAKEELRKQNDDLEAEACPPCILFQSMMVAGYGCRVCFRLKQNSSLDRKRLARKGK